jgi:hypothetical protein
MSIWYKLKHRPRNVKFGELEDSLVKDMIVLGTRSNNIRERLFTEKDLHTRTSARKECGMAPMDANGRKFGQGQIDQRRMAKPQNTKQQHQTTREDQRIVVEVPQRMANGCGQYLVNNVEDVVRIVISAGCARSEAQKVDNQE